MEKKKELGCYAAAGVVTTAVNYVIYALLLAGNCPYLAANCLAWTGAVLAAYVMNRSWVFHSDGRVGKELFQFILLRLVTLTAETLLLYMAVDCIRIHPVPAKLLVSVVTVLANYSLCKYGIFRKGEK